MMLKQTLVAVLLACITLISAGCGSGTPEADVTYISTLAHSYLDPQRMSWLHDIRTARNLYEPLVKYDFVNYKVTPGVAEKWEVSDDELTYTFHLRKDAKWSNGDAVTSADFVYAWRRAMLPDQAASYSELFFPIKGAKEFFSWRSEQTKQFAKDYPGGSQEVADKMWAETETKFNELVGVKAPDANTVIIELKKPTPYYLELIAFITYAPVHKTSVEAVTSINSDSGMVITDSSYWSTPEMVVNNGPYQIKQRNFKQFLLMTANPHYWNKGAMKNQSLLERIIENPETALRTFEDPRENIDLWPDVPTSGSLAEMLVNSAQKGDRKDVHVVQAAGNYFYNFNCTAKTTENGEPNPLLDARVRRALAMSIDRKYIVDRVTRLHEPIAKTFIPPHVMKDYNSPLDRGLTFDPEQAKTLLTEAGFPEGKNFPSLTLLYNTGSFHQQPAQAVVKMWEENLGIQVNLQGLEPKVFGDRLRRKDFEISRASWFGDYPDPTTFLNKLAIDSNNNDTGWDNEQYNELLKQAANTIDVDKRMRLLEQAEGLMLEQAPMAQLFTWIQLRLYDENKVKGFKEQDNSWNTYDFYKIHVVK
ncbi:peptide ABC transporter substrate-binding protein [Planctomycetota bacterium]|nr:peptide ABC transporter substrate-binding protein [Planctomycetota bacterium]